METITTLIPNTQPYNLVVALAVEGYTVTGMRLRLKAYGYDISSIPDIALIRILREHRTDIEDIRAGYDKDMDLLYGLSNLLVRVRRLCKMAEAIEDMAKRDERWATAYRQYLAQIRIEMEPFGIRVSMDDGWAELLNKVLDAGRQAESQLDLGVGVEAGVDAEVGDE